MSLGTTRVEMRPRPYQTELLYKALKENSIIFLGTGSGKTFIATMLIKELSASITQNSQRTVFLVPAVALAHQQSNFFNETLSYKARSLTGTDNVDNWDEDQWQTQLAGYQVLVMVHQVFLEAIQKVYLRWEEINLLILDECHHASKEHPYAQIMRNLKEYRLHCTPDMSQPHVCGLSASLVAEKTEVFQFRNKMRALENLLDAKVITVENLATYIKYMTSPEERIVSFTDEPGCLGHFDSGPFGVELEAVPGSAHGMDLGGIAWKKASASDKRDLKKVRNTVICTLKVLDDVGLALAPAAFETLLSDIIEMKLVLTNCDYEETLLRVAQEQVLRWQSKVDMVLKQSKLDEEGLLSQFTTDKVQTLVELISDFVQNQLRSQSPVPDDRGQTRQAPAITGLIFVKEKIATSTLALALRRAFKYIPHLAELKVDHAVGGQTAFNFKKVGQLEQARMMAEAKKLQELLKDFATGKVNIIVATAVLEEGIDIRQCNFVVRFEPPPNFRAYVQSKGRARAKPSEYILMIAEGEMGKMMGSIKSYRTIEKMQMSTIHPTVEEEEVEDGDEPQVYLADPTHPIDSARITDLGAISLVHRYVQSLPSDRFTYLAPFWDNVSPRPETPRVRLLSGLGCDSAQSIVHVVLHLPHLSPLRDPIVGPPRNDKIAAKRACALKAVEFLHKHGELTDKLKPKLRLKEDPDPSGEKVGTTKRKTYYPKPKFGPFSSLENTPEAVGHLYQLDLELVDPRQEFENHKRYAIYQPQAHSGKLGIILGQPLPEVGLKAFSLYNYSGRIRAQFRKLRTMAYTPRRPDLDEFHELVLRDVLQTTDPWHTYQGWANRDYLLVPLRHEAIDDQLLRSLHDSPDPNEWANLTNAVVIPTHRQMGRFIVEEVVHDMSPKALMPGHETQTFRQHYDRQYGLVIRDPDQPLLRVSNADAQLDHRHPYPIQKRRKTDDESFLKGRTLLIPELLRIHPIPGSLWRELQLFPFVVHRIESFLKVDAFQSKMGLKRDQADDPRTTFEPPSTRSNFKDLIQDWSQSGAITSPTGAELLEPLTFRACGESFDLERLEILGDSFLKYWASVFTYFQNGQVLNEGDLTQLRTRIISNRNLYLRAKAFGLQDLVDPLKFEPRRNWNPPGYVDEAQVEAMVCEWDVEDRRSTHSTRSFTLFDVLRKDEILGLASARQAGHQVPDDAKAKLIKTAKARLATDDGEDDGSLKARSSPSNMDFGVWPRNHALVHDKALADAVEAIIGCFLAHRGPAGALKSMAVLGLIPTEQSEGGESHIPEFEPAHNAFHEQVNPRTVGRKFEKLEGLAQISLVENIIGYEFQEKSWLLQALTHCSYQANSITDSYERLEFLGDAVLDYLVSCHLVSQYPLTSPGELTALRSALVCNNTLAEIVVKQGLHKFLLQHSSPLFNKINAYANGILSDLVKLHGQDNEAEVIKSNLDVLNEVDCPSLDAVEIPKVLGDIMEAIIGAVFIDTKFSLPVVWTVIQRVFPTMDEVIALKPQSPIKVLYEKFPNRIKFRVGSKAEIEKTVMIVEVQSSTGLLYLFKGQGPNKRLAKEAAARCCLREIQRRPLVLK